MELKNIVGLVGTDLSELDRVTLRALVKIDDPQQRRGPIDCRWQLLQHFEVQLDRTASLLLGV